MRLIDAEGNQVGVVQLRDALIQAKEAALDLVEISPNAEPPVCRIMDFGKFQFETNKKVAAAKKKQKQTQVKEIKFRPGIEDGDYQVKLRNLIRFLENGDKVKVTLRFRGREMAHQELGLKVLQRLEGDVGEAGIIETKAKREGRQLLMVFSPKKK